MLLQADSLIWQVEIILKQPWAQPVGYTQRILNYDQDKLTMIETHNKYVHSI